jgi:hypothetical protein
MDAHAPRQAYQKMLEAGTKGQLCEWVAIWKEKEELHLL